MIWGILVCGLQILAIRPFDWWEGVSENPKQVRTNWFQHSLKDHRVVLHPKGPKGAYLFPSFSVAPFFSLIVTLSTPKKGSLGCVVFRGRPKDGGNPPKRRVPTPKKDEPPILGHPSFAPSAREGGVPFPKKLHGSPTRVVAAQAWCLVPAPRRALTPKGGALKLVGKTTLLP